VLAAARSSGWLVWVWVLPPVEDFFGLVDECSLLSRLRDMLVRFEERADVDRLPAPEVSVNGPVEGELQRAAVEV